MVFFFFFFFLVVCLAAMAPFSVLLNTYYPDSKGPIEYPKMLYHPKGEYKMAPGGAADCCNSR